MYSNMFSADAASRRVLYYYYDVVAVSVGTAANRMGNLAQGCASCRFPGNQCCATQARCSVLEHVRYCPADAPKLRTALDFQIGKSL